jgi:hypothetical protein
MLMREDAALEDVSLVFGVARGLISTAVNSRFADGYLGLSCVSAIFATSQPSCSI